MNLQLAKGDPKNSTLSTIRIQRNTQQMKEQGKNTPDQTNEAVYLKKIQSNESKDDPKSWK